MTAVATERARYRTAEQELAEALEGLAPHLSQVVAKALGPVKTIELAHAVGRAVAAGVRRRATQDTYERLTGLYELLEAGLDGVADCSTDEVPGDA